MIKAVVSPNACLWPGERQAFVHLLTRCSRHTKSVYEFYFEFYALSKRIDLTLGGPYSSIPVVSNPSGPGCLHCIPVKYFPAHCELHYHLRSFMPPELTYCCGRCNKYTRCEQSLASNAKEYCGKCGVSYRKMYERGRRHLNPPPGTNRWYNEGQF